MERVAVEIDWGRGVVRECIDGETRNGALGLRWLLATLPSMQGAP